ncbi:uncharacterized protein CELE_Y44E3A.1 [Caenorhabditis elegans]|uniref:Uncharacterized protein n=3 Tax=Caenorhabditis elegans TaxID=6239 RepID=Q9TXZ1_CAEEL|nr:Uncharacterized protein CELE_Y44E3A.1 [Caenorhabditis elegans]CCD73441.1 Uncharacterized protein CELE_Y44E3A.1 [Caenorhabditis elegans]|eukprot:NP_491145.1 Uncharacterized protein CELE_Y44E3A.1 [Caenorhabditis elegans]
MDSEHHEIFQFAISLLSESPTFLHSLVPPPAVPLAFRVTDYAVRRVSEKQNILLHNYFLNKYEIGKMNAEIVLVGDAFFNERAQYHGFLRLNYRILHRYEQIHEIFLFSLNNARTMAQREYEIRKLEGINAIIISTRNMILSCEKKNECKLFSD